MRPPKIRHICATAVLLAAAATASAQSVESLAPIVGVWQSDTTNGGTSAVSNCAWTSAHTAVLCDQAVTTKTATLHALSLFTYSTADKKFVFYGLSHPGDPMRPTPLAIDGKSWTYGGVAKDPDGRYSKTVNVFGNGDSYQWRSMSSPDGKSWTTVAQGKSVRRK